MGYSTDFEGRFEITPALKPEHVLYLQKFNDTRRMKRDEREAHHLTDTVRALTDLPVGKYGEYFVGGGGMAGQDRDSSILSLNDPPPSQPGLWCGWTVTDDGRYLEWDGGEKFYDYVPWIRYVIVHFLTRWGYLLNGQVQWRGEEFSDNGKITVENNIVKAERMTW